MLPLLIESTDSYAGKSLVCLGLGLKFQKDGFKIAYFKPLGRAPLRIGKVTTDEDAVFIQEALHLDEPLELLCPIVVTQDLIIDAYDGKVKGLEKNIVDAYHRVSRGKDLVLIGGGGSLHEGTLFGLSSLTLARHFKAKVILIDSAEHEVHIDCILRAKEGLKEDLIGIVLNRIPDERVDFITNRIIPFLKRRDIDVLGTIPHDPLLNSVSVRELQHILNGQFLCGEKYDTDLIEKFFIGSMNVDKAMNYFKKFKHKAVIVGGDRPDIILAALETSTSCIVLTGGLSPDDILLAKAEEMKIPMMLVTDDTYTTVQKVDKVLGRLRVKEEKKVKRGAALIEKEIHFNLLYKKLGLRKKGRS